MPPVNPFAGNPLVSRDDLQRATTSLWTPVRERLSPGRARAKLGETGAMYPSTPAELEGFARPLWGLVPLAAGGGEVDWEPVVEGLTNGTDPKHPEYWGFGGHDQRLVEMAAIGFALALVPEHTFDPLSPRAQQQLVTWLAGINDAMDGVNNWLFFQVLVNEGLRRIGSSEYDPDATAAQLDRLEGFYLDDGWYADGDFPQRDYYIPWAMHFYGLVYARLAGDRDPARAARFRERAAIFAPDFAHWFAEDGAALPFGRSLTYRFAQSAFWGALAFADVEGVPWGEAKGLLLRNLRWWAQQPIFDNDGLLTIGYSYPNLGMSEQYNAPGSPYWAMKAFLPLAVPEEHPFWASPEAPSSGLDEIRLQPHARFVVRREPTGAVTALSGGQFNWFMRGASSKYGKFAYSTDFGFSVPGGPHQLEQQAADSMLALSDDDGDHWRVRYRIDETLLVDDVVWTRWTPWPEEVTVDTWLRFHGPWQIRVHRVVTTRELWTAEGAFALDSTGDDPADPHGQNVSGVGSACAIYPAGSVGIMDPTGQRDGDVVAPVPNSNVLHQRTVIPTLRSHLGAGTHLVTTGVLASTDPDAWVASWSNPPSGQIWDAIPTS